MMSEKYQTAESHEVHVLESQNSLVEGKKRYYPTQTLIPVSCDHVYIYVCFLNVTINFSVSQIFY